MNRDPGKNSSVMLLILQWNGAADTRVCLQSLAQVDYPELQVVVLDNGSTDGSDVVIETEFPDVLLVRLHANLLITIARNIGMQRALESGVDYVCFLDNDTEVDPQFMRHLLDASSSGARVGIVGPKILYHDRPGIIWSAGTQVISPIGLIRHHGIRRRDNDAFNRRRPVDAVAGCCLLASSEMVREVGLLDPGYVMYTEDTDWCARARELGWQVLYAPTSRVYHKVSASSGGGLTAFKAYHRVISTHRFFRAHSPWYHWLTIVPFIGAGLLLMTLVQVTRGNGRAVKGLYRGFLDVLIGGRRWAPSP